MIRRICAAALITAVSSVALTACQAGSAPEPGPEMGNATPVASPPAGDVDGEVLDVGAVTDLVAAGDRLAARVGDDLLVGTLADFRSGDVDTTPVDGCTDVTATGDDVVVTCGTEVRVLGPHERTINLDDPAQTAVLTTSGVLVAASGTEATAQVYVDGELDDEFSVAGPTDELLALPVSGGDDAVLRINRETTTIQDVRWTEGRQGGTLRVGVGVGSMAAGDDGMAVVSDTSGSQIMIYTGDDVVRLHQTSPVPESPWATAWDGQLAWVASTADNRATGYSISGGVPVQESEFATIADVRAMVSTPEGLVLGGADGLQIASTPRTTE